MVSVLLEIDEVDSGLINAELNLNMFHHHAFLFQSFYPAFDLEHIFMKN